MPVLMERAVRIVEIRTEFLFVHEACDEDSSAGPASQAAGANPCATVSTDRLCSTLPPTEPRSSHGPFDQSTRPT